MSKTKPSSPVEEGHTAGLEKIPLPISVDPLVGQPGAELWARRGSFDVLIGECTEKSFADEIAAAVNERPDFLARNEMLVKALEPFAKYAEQMRATQKRSGGWPKPETELGVEWGVYSDSGLTCGDFLRAADLLATLSGGGK
jgi:hypothetical protein